MKPFKNNLLTIATGVVLVSAISCDKKSSDNAVPDSGPYFPKVKAIIQNNCLTCHSSSGTWAGRPTAFDTDAQIAAASASIKSAVNDPVTVQNKRMPEGGTLSASDIDIIVKWYNKGGKITD